MRRRANAVRRMQSNAKINGRCRLRMQGAGEEELGRQNDTAYDWRCAAADIFERDSAIAAAAPVS